MEIALPSVPIFVISFSDMILPFESYINNPCPPFPSISITLPRSSLLSASSMKIPSASVPVESMVLVKISFNSVFHNHTALPLSPEFDMVLLIKVMSYELSEIAVHIAPLPEAVIIFALI